MGSPPGVAARSAAVGTSLGLAPQTRLVRTPNQSTTAKGAGDEAMFRRACALGLEGIISKRLDKPYVSGRCTSWVKVKNPDYGRR
jgi:ATP-dependent DNA ligase